MTELSTAAGSHLDDAEPYYLIHTYEHRAYPLSPERAFSIGRDSRCNIMVSEVAVSRQHAELRPEGAHVVLHPVGSTPTFLNGAHVTTPRTLRPGDTIAVGSMRFVFAREPLPVAIHVAPAQDRMISVNEHVSDKRPTLTYPMQVVPTGGTKRPSRLPLFIGALVAVALVYVAIQLVAS